MSEKMRYALFVSVVLIGILDLQTCDGNYDCLKLSSGKDICFMFEDTLKTFEESKQFCQNNGGFLLEIYDSEMQRFVEQFVKSKTTFLIAWLNLIRIDPNTWVWGGQPGNKLSYSNWETSNPASYGIDQAFMFSNYKWMNSNDPKQISTICIQGSRELYLSEASTTPTIITTTTTTTNAPVQKPESVLTVPATTTTATTSTKTTTKASISTKTTTTTTNSAFSSSSSEPIQTPTPNGTLLTELPNTGPSSSTGLGLGLGLGLTGLVLVIVSSLLVAKFVFHKEIPVPFKSSSNKTSTALRSETSHHINTGYEQIHEKLPEKSTYAEVVMSKSPEPPSNSNLNYVGFQDLNQSSSGGPSQAQNFVLNV